MDIRIGLMRIGMAILTVGILMAVSCSHDGRGQAEEDEFCASAITIDQDGRRLLNRRMVTKENADRINECLDQAGISNFRIVGDLPDFWPKRNHT